MSTGPSEAQVEVAPPGAALADQPPAPADAPVVAADQPPVAALADQPAPPTKPVARKPMTKKDLIARLTAATKLTKRQVNSVLDTLYDVLVSELKTNEVVTLPGLVKFKVVEQKARPERRSVNPSTHQPMTVPAKPAQKALRSDPFKALKDGALKG